jgi:sulfite oxidase
MEKAISLDGDVVLAMRMNGEQLPVDHGFPVRVVVPGARSHDRTTSFF